MKLVRDGAAIDYPAPPATAASDAAFRAWFPAYLEPAPNARSKCKVCKQAIAAGEQRLVVSRGREPGDDVAHVGCGLDKRFRAGLVDVLTRDRRALPDRERLEADLAQPTKAKAKKSPGP